MKKNIIRRSFFFNKIFSKYFTRLVHLKRKPYLKKRSIKTPDENYNSLFLLLKPNNTFITIKGNDVVKMHTITGGSSGFKGPKRSTPYSRHVVAKNMSYYIFKTKIRDAFDLYFNCNTNRKFFFFFKGLITKPFSVRYMVKNKMASHGFLRAKKKRRS